MCSLCTVWRELKVERGEEEGKSGQVFNSGGRSPLMRSLLVRKEERAENTPDGYDTSG